MTINENGEVVVDSKARGLKKGMKNIVSKAEELRLDPAMPVVFGYSGMDDANARKLQEECSHLVSTDEEPLSLSEVLAVHAGPDAAGIGFFAEED